MLNFDIKGNLRQRKGVIQYLKIFTHATCLGHEESLIMIYDDHKDHSFFRVSVGLEDANDLKVDLDQGLSIMKVG